VASDEAPRWLTLTVLAALSIGAFVTFRVATSQRPPQPQVTEAEKEARWKERDRAREREILAGHEKLAVEAIQRAVLTVKEMMKNPDDATTRNVRALFDDDGKPYAVCGEVVGTNGFGAKIRHHFIASALPTGNVYIADHEEGGRGQRLWFKHCRK
jgi:hypothetical protein